MFLGIQGTECNANVLLHRCYNLEAGTSFSSMNPTFQLAEVMSVFRQLSLVDIQFTFFSYLTSTFHCNYQLLWIFCASFY